MARRRKGTNFTLVFAHNNHHQERESTFTNTVRNVNINFNIFIHGYRAITILAHLLMCDVVDETPREFVKSKSSTFNFFSSFNDTHSLCLAGISSFFLSLKHIIL